MITDEEKKALIAVRSAAASMREFLPGVADAMDRMVIREARIAAGSYVLMPAAKNPGADDDIVAALAEGAP